MKTSAAGKRFTLSTLIRALKRRWLYVLLPALLLIPAVAFYAQQLPQRFRARALVGAQPVAQNRLKFGGRTEVAPVQSAQDQLRTIRDTLLSQTALEMVIGDRRLNLLVPGQPSRKAVEGLRAAIQIQVESPDSFYIGFEGAQPRQTMAVTNRLASLFVERNSALRDHRVVLEDNFFDAEVARAQTQLGEQEERLKSYKQSGAQQLPERLANNLKQLELLQQQIQNKTDQITAAEASRSAANEELIALDRQGVLAPEPVETTAQENVLAELRRKLAQLRLRYTPEHPDIIRAENEIRDLAAAPPAPVPVVHRQPTPVQMRYFSLQAELKSIEPRIRNYSQERDGLRAQLQNYERVVNSSPGYETALSERIRDAAVTRNNYESLVAKQQDAKRNQRADKIDDSIEYRIIDAAQLPTEPYSPHRFRMILFGLAAGLGLGIVGVVFAERMDTSFESSEQFEEVMGIPVLSTVPSIPSVEPRAKHARGKVTSIQTSSAGATSGMLTPEQQRHFQKNRIAVLSDPHGIASQQYGILALKIQKWMDKTGGKILAITSSTGEEGKSVTALNLSLALASSVEGGVLLVDCDLRLPQVQERLGIAGGRGLADLLAEGGGNPSLLISRVGDLDVLTAGTKSDGRTGLLAGSRARAIFAGLRDRYRVILLDCPPVVPIADSHTLAGLADGVVMVVRARSTRPELLQRAIDSLDAGNFVGVVLNDVEFEGTSYGYAYQYYQRHYLGRRQ